MTCSRAANTANPGTVWSWLPLTSSLRIGLVLRNALLVFGEHEDAGPAPVAYDTWFTNGRPGATVVFPRTGEPIALLPGPMFIMDHLESSRRGETMWIPPHNLRGARTSGTIIETLDRLGLAEAAIGVVGLGPHMPWHPEGIIPHGLWSKVLSRCPEADFRPVDLPFGQLIMRLSQEEIAVVRHSAGIGDAMVKAMVATAAPGVPESRVYAAGMAAGHGHGSLPPAMHLWSGPDVVAAGPPAWGHRPQAPRILDNGDVIYALRGLDGPASRWTHGRKAQVQHRYEDLPAARPDISHAPV
jgi:Xaa-Pro aminopeptidase